MQGLMINPSDAQEGLSWRIVNVENEHKPVITLWLYLDKSMKEEKGFLLMEAQRYWGKQWGNYLS